MRLISNKTLREFARREPKAEIALQSWRRIIEQSAFPNFASLRRTFNAVDKVGDYFVFDIAGNHFRVIAAIHFNTQVLFVRHVFTHAEYERWKP